jgi:hypothetical protein
MKFWHLTSMFRSEEDLLKQTLNQSRWQKYFDHYLNLTHIVKTQDRKILDEEIPDDLAVEMCSKSKIKFWFYPHMTPPLLSSYKFANSFPVDELSTKEAYKKFGGHHLEEAVEKSYTEIFDI